MMAAVVGPNDRARKVARRAVSAEGGWSTPRSKAARIAGSSGGRSERDTLLAFGPGSADRVELGDHAVAKGIDEVVDVARRGREGAEDVDRARCAGEAGGGIEGGSRVPKAVGHNAVHRTLGALEHEAQAGTHEWGGLASASAGASGEDEPG